MLPHRPDLMSSLPELTIHQAELLQTMHAAIDAAFDEMWSARHQSSFETPEEVAEDREAAMAREHAFADKVFGATAEVAVRTGKPVTILFDVDETFVKKTYTNDGSSLDLVRPAFIPLIQTLDEVLADKLSIGLLTTRGQSHLDAELQNPTFLAGVKDKIDPNYVLSARSGSPATESFPDYMYDSHEDARDNLGDFLNSTLIFDDDLATMRAIQKVTASRLTWTGSKLPILKHLVDTHPEHAFVYVDDAASASVINPNYSPNLATVQVYDDAAFWGLN
jgi:hypothetical protein